MRHIVLLAFLFAAMPVSSEEKVYISITCKSYGRYAHCVAHNADGLAEPVWVYSKKPAYEVYGLTAVIEVKQKKWTALTFYATDAVRTHVITVYLRSENDRADLCNPKEEKCP